MFEKKTVYPMRIVPFVSASSPFLAKFTLAYKGAAFLNEKSSKSDRHGP